MKTIKVVDCPSGRFEIGDKVRFKDGDGRIHVIKEFEEKEGIHGPNMFLVHFEDDTAHGFLHPDYTNMVLVEKAAEDVDDGLSWEDMKAVHRFINEVWFWGDFNYCPEDVRPFYDEVLTRYRNWKKVTNKQK